jgi:hypothetical protein
MAARYHPARNLEPMPSRPVRFIGGAGLLFLSAVASQYCASKPVEVPPPPPDVKAIVSVKELMENVIDPIADNVFDAVGSDVTAKGIVETKPTTDEDWAKVMMGAVTLAEGSNLLKLPRPVAPPGDTNTSSGPNAPELSPEDIQKKIDADRPLWNKHADDLREAGLKVMAIVRKKDVAALFQAGSDLDKACENCHLEYWYPGDKKTVLEDEAKRATFGTPGKK